MSRLQDRSGEIVGLRFSCNSLQQAELSMEGGTIRLYIQFSMFARHKDKSPYVIRTHKGELASMSSYKIRGENWRTLPAEEKRFLVRNGLNILETYFNER